MTSMDWVPKKKATGKMFEGITSLTRRGSTVSRIVQTSHVYVPSQTAREIAGGDIKQRVTHHNYFLIGRASERGARVTLPDDFHTNARS